MELRLKLILFSFSLFLINGTIAIDKHPHGQGETLIEIERSGDTANFISKEEFINKTLLHPQVKDRKIVVLSIVGDYRYGKSFFLDYCLRYLYAAYRSVNKGEIKTISNWLGDENDPLLGFSWKHGSSHDTKGLMMWSDVFLYDAPDGEKIAIVVIDTQGLFEKGSNSDENIKMLSFITLLSSIQIFNIKERIQEDQIGYLHNALELADVITIKQPGYLKEKAFQHLTFLIRDFDGIEHAFGYEGGQGFYEDFFEDLTKHPNANKREQKLPSASIMRERIKNSYNNISCFLLNVPGDVTKIRKNSFKGEWGKLDPEFLENLKKLIESLLKHDNLVPKTLLGADITGEKLKDILIDFSEFYSKFKKLPVEDVYQEIIENKMKAIKKEKLNGYRMAMNDIKMEYDRSDFGNWLRNKHESYLKQAEDEFSNAEKIEDKETKNRFQQELREEIEVFFKDFEEERIKVYTKMNTKKEMQSIVDKILSEYRKNISDYEEENSLEKFDEKHLELKNLLLMEFTNEAEKFNDADEGAIYKQKLEKEINNIFDILKENAKERGEKKTTREVTKSYVKKYMESMDAENDYTVEDFEAYMNQKHSKYKNESVQGFLDSAAKDFSSQQVERIRQTLNKDIDHKFLEIKKSKKKVYETFKNLYDEGIKAELNQIVQNLLYQYEHLMDKNVALSADDFPSTLDRKHSSVKDEILQKYQDQSQKFNVSRFVDNFKQQLEKSMEEKYLSWKPKKLGEHGEFVKTEQKNVINEIKVLIQKYKFKYQDIMQENLPPRNAKNFKNLIEEKHDNVTQTILKDFVKEAKSSNESFVNELKKEVEIIYEKLSQKEDSNLMNPMQQADIIRSLKVDAAIFKKLSDYKVLIGQNINYDQDNFESWLQSKHENLTQDILKEFSTLPEITESVNSTDIQEKLRKEMDDEFDKWRVSPMEIYEMRKKKKDDEETVALDSLEDLQFRAFQANLVTGLPYGTENDTFVKILLEKYDTAKNSALNDFSKASNISANPMKKGTRIDNLTKKIDKFFDDFKTMAVQQNSEKLRALDDEKKNMLLELANEKISDFRKNIAQLATTYKEADYEKDDFLSRIENDFEELRYKLLKDFRAEAEELLGTSLVSRIENDDKLSPKTLSKDINRKIDNQFKTWKNDMIKQQEKYKRKKKVVTDEKLDGIVEEKLNQYKTEMEEKVKDIDNPNVLHTIHIIAKEKAIDAYNSAAADVEDKSSVENYLRKLEDKIAIAYTEIKITYKEPTNNDPTDSTDMPDIDNEPDINNPSAGNSSTSTGINMASDTIGTWVPWDGSKSNFPSNAVIGGFKQGESCAVARFGGKAGQWCKGDGRATVNDGCKNTPHDSSKFEILTHKNWKYVEKSEADNFTPITNDGEKLCKAYNTRGVEHLGRVDKINNHCYFGYNLNVRDYYVLVRG